MNNVTREEAIKGAFMGAIVADALCLGSHYEYDAQKINKAYGNKPIEKFMSPGEMMGDRLTVSAGANVTIIQARVQGERQTMVIIIL